MMKRIMLFGSGELGKEFVIAAKRLGQYVIAVDHYENAPAMQVADSFAVIDMLDGNALDEVVAQYTPDIIVPEIEAIRTERFYAYEENGIQVVPSAKAANYTMNRKAIRDLAARELGIKTANFRYAQHMEDFRLAIDEIGLPCVVKPLMSSSGKGQSVVKSEDEIESAWKMAMEGSRGDIVEVIIEEFIDFKFEITLLTVTQKNGATLFCAPIGHRQERGDYQESWQPMPMNGDLLKKAQTMADKVTSALGGSGIWGVEFFITDNDVYFSELSPRPHDTGMVTLAGTQNFNEFELHLRAVLGIPIMEITQERIGASAVILYEKDEVKEPRYEGIEAIGELPKTDLKIFGKPSTRKYRRMGVVVCYDEVGEDVVAVKDRAVSAAKLVRVF